MRSLEQIITLLPCCSSVCLSVRPSGTGVHCDHTVHAIARIRQCSGHPDTKTYPPTPSRLFLVPPKVGYGCERGVISQKRLKLEVKLLLSANRKLHVHIPHRLARQRMTFSDLEWPFHIACYLCGSWTSCFDGRMALHCTTYCFRYQ